MKRARGFPLLCIAGTCTLSGTANWAATVQTLGSGSAAAQVELSATFGSLTSTNVSHLDNYVEGALRVFTSGNNWAADLNLAAKLDPFHGANDPDRAFFAISAANEDWVTIQTTNRAAIHGVELMYGNTWTTGDIYGQYPWGNYNGVLEWRTLQNDLVISSGQAGSPALLPVGTVVGFYDPAGFDQLQVRCVIATSGNPNLQAIALDNLNVMLSNLPPAPVVWPGDFALDPLNGKPSVTVYDTIPGCQYRLVFADTLNMPPTNPVNPPGWVAGGSVITLSDTNNPPGAQRFYRVQVK